MNTKVEFCDPHDISKHTIKKAAELLKNGELVAFPTETVYGLGANALDPEAVAKIFIAKGRPADNPLIVHVSEIAQLSGIAKDVPPIALKLAKKFWPGPLTIILKKKESIPSIVTAGLPTVAVRMPSHPIALELIKCTGTPIAAPSANKSGRPSPTRAEHVIDDLSGKIPLILDGGPTEVGLESTIIDIQRHIPIILRPGGITLEQLKEIIPEIEVYSTGDDPKIEKIPLSPGIKYTHYAPKASLILYLGNISHISSQIVIDTKQYLNENRKVGILNLIPHQAYNLIKKQFPMVKIMTPSLKGNLDEIATNLFANLREFDDLGIEIILTESVKPIGPGLAIMNRLKKAANQIREI